MNLLLWVLGSELCSSARAASVLDHGAFQPPKHFQKNVTRNLTMLLGRKSLFPCSQLSLNEFNETPIKKLHRTLQEPDRVILALIRKAKVRRITRDSLKQQREGPDPLDATPWDVVTALKTL